MSNKDLPAFQDKSYDKERKSLFYETELSMRDYFAAKAMQATLSNPHTMSEMVKRFPPEMDMMEGISGYAYLVADAMLEARKS